jgi:precorrin-3B synthase
MSGRTEGGDVGRVASPIGVFGLVEDNLALGIGLPFGQTGAQALHSFTETAAACGASEIRFAPGRALLAVGLAADGCDRLREAADLLGFVTDPADARLFIAACAGSPACRSAFVDTKAIAADIARSAADLLDGSFILHVSGCPKGCARPHGPALSLVGTAPGRCDILDENEDAAIAQAGGGDAAAFLSELALLFRRRHRPGETARAFLDRSGNAGLGSIPGKGKR